MNKAEKMTRDQMTRDMLESADTQATTPTLDENDNLHEFMGETVFEGLKRPFGRGGSSQNFSCPTFTPKLCLHLQHCAA